MGKAPKAAALRALATVIAASGLVAACTYAGRDDAISQRFTWFSYLNGDDIRRRCAPGALDRYRLVYNGVYIQQARTYDIVPESDGPALGPPDAAQAGTPPGYILRARVLGPNDLSNVEIPFDTVFQDPLDILAPFAGRKSTLKLSGRDIDELDRRLAASGMFQPAPEGLYLRSEDFFWIGVACVNGRLAFNAWKYPSSRFEALTFPPLLFSWDQTFVPVNPPRSISPFEIYGEASPRDPRVQFTLTVGENGLRGTGTLF